MDSIKSTISERYDALQASMNVDTSKNVFDQYAAIEERLNDLETTIQAWLDFAKDEPNLTIWYAEASNTNAAYYRSVKAYYDCLKADTMVEYICNAINEL